MQNYNLVPGGMVATYGTVIFIAGLLLNILFALCLWRDASGVRDGKERTTVLPAFVWALGGLVLGWIAVALYWVVNYSAFARKKDEA